MEQLSARPCRELILTYQDGAPVRIAFAAIALAIIWGAPAAADEIRILSSRGGELGHFIELFDDLRAQIG
jgi:hypothetical protein